MLGLPQVLDPRNEDWEEARQQLESPLTPDEFDSARATTFNAHYTCPAVIRAMYAALQRFGAAIPRSRGDIKRGEQPARRR